jgi:hypothetical protein
VVLDSDREAEFCRVVESHPEVKPGAERDIRSSGARTAPVAELGSRLPGPASPPALSA